jgi:hemerythrin
MSNAASLPDYPEVPELHWTDGLRTGDARMDETHEDFVRQLAALRRLPPAAQLEAFRALTRHTVAHFAQEDRWMLATGFAPDNCHTLQHKSILETLQAVETHWLQGDTDIISRMADALAEWFPVHARTMDAGLAQHMQSLGFDSRTEHLPDPSRVRPASMSGCGSVSCS